MTYDEALAIRKKWADGAAAELLGFKAALHDPSPRLMSAEHYLQQRFDQGFADAKAILAAHEVKV